MADFALNDCVSHYRLIERIGEGGMGQVWLAEDTALPRRVVVKLVHASLATDAGSTERLLREARVAASVDHPNVVTVYEAGIHEGQPFLVTQFLEGETLEQRLARGPLPVPDAIALARSLADALAEVHALGIVHRDLKPANIVMTARGPRILDFGLSAMNGNTRITQTGDLMGTPLAMSPEQFQGLVPDARSDLWSLGVILYQALTGVRPFDGDNALVVAHRVLNENPDPPSRRVATVTPALDAIVTRLLAKDPKHRYARAEDVLADLAILRSDALPPRAPAAPEPRLGVLYFDVLSQEPDDEFLAAGLTEDLIVDLARVGGLRIAARGEVLPYRDRNLPPRTVARELGVDYVLQGSVRRAGLRGRISAQLVRASDGHAIWAERFDRTLEDLFDVQAEISKRIVEALEVTLRPGEREMLDRPPTRNREAYAEYLRGRTLADEVRRSSIRRAEEHYRRAIALDPEFALAYAALAECLARRAAYWWGEAELFEEARVQARQALALDPGLPQAHKALGMIHNAQGNPAGLLEEVEAARLLDSNDPQIMVWVGRSYMALGRPNDAIGLLERALELRPRDYRVWSAYGDCADMLGRKEAVTEVLVTMRELLMDALERNPHDTYVRALLAIVFAQSGEHEAGVAQAERAVAEEREDGRVYYNAACAFTYAGQDRRAIEMIRTLIESHPGFPTSWLRRDPDLSALRKHPEFVALIGEAE